MLIIGQIKDTSGRGFVCFDRFNPAVIDDKLIKISQDTKGQLGRPCIAAKLKCGACIIFKIYRGLLCFQKKFACTADTKTIVRSLCDTADLNGIFVNNVFVRFGITLLVIDIPAKECEQRVNELASYLRFIVLAGFIRFTMRIKTLNQFNNFFRSSPLILSLLSAG